MVGLTLPSTHSSAQLILIASIIDVFSAFNDISLTFFSLVYQANEFVLVGFQYPRLDDSPTIAANSLTSDVSTKFDCVSQVYWFKYRFVELYQPPECQSHATYLDDLTYEQTTSECTNVMRTKQTL